MRNNIITPVPGSKAVVVFGAVTAGKTIIANKVSNKLNLPLINEETIGPYYKMLDNLNPYRHKEAIYEHCWFYKKFFLFKHLYEKNLFVFLKVDEILLRENYRQRLSKSAKGDFVDMDPTKQQVEIVKDLAFLKEDMKNSNAKLLILEIDKRSHYRSAINRIISAYNNLHLSFEIES